MSSLLRARKLKQTAVSLQRSLATYTPGEALHGYTIDEVLPVPSLSLTAVSLTHQATGAQHLHIDRADTNNVFSVIFKTNPPDASGVPHILEHTTLCGSAKYPVRDPFFKMLNRSLANFMNAMTGHDYTFYPFSTTNKKDYENLRDVYLLSVLEPLLLEEDFHQEGWRLENADPLDVASPLIFKGVVYNEMKGQVSNAAYYYYIKFQEAVYPALGNSGGDPVKMTDLAYADLVRFHKQNYHPSNAKVYTYGDLPLAEQLEYLDREFAKYGNEPSVREVKKPIALEKSVVVEIPGPVDPMAPLGEQIQTSLTWFCGNPRDVYETFCMKLLGTLLMDGHASPFYQKLVEAGVGSDFSVTSGFDSTTELNSFTVGLQGMTRAKLDGLKATVELILQEVRADLEGSNGKVFDRRVRAMLHSMELAKKDQKADFGMGLLYGIAPGWANEIHPFESLRFDSHVQRFKAEYAQGGVFERLIDRYLLLQPTFTFSMVPSGGFKKGGIEEEKARLAVKVDRLTETDKEEVYARGLRLLKKQEMVEDVSVLPSLLLDDIPRMGQYPAIQRGVEGATEVTQRVTATNGLTYIRGLRPIPHIPAAYYPFLPLFTDCLTNLGTSRLMSDLEGDIQLYTGGLSASVGVRPDPNAFATPTLHFSIAGSALNPNVSKVFSLFGELLGSTNFRNVDKLTALIKLMGANNISSLAESGHSYARSLAGADLTPVKSIQDQLSGIGQIQFIQQLNRWVETNQLETRVIPVLEELQQLIVGSNGMRFHMIHDAETRSENERLLQSFVSQLPAHVGGENHLGAFTEKFHASGIAGISSKKFVNLPFQVNYASLCVPAVPYTHRDGASLQVLSNLLTFRHLHREIREKGGAYGAGASYSSTDGVLGYYSYRDPNPHRSLDLFKQCGEYVETAAWDSQMLQEAKLLIFQGIDAPSSVRNDGAIEFRDAITPEMRQHRRERLLECLLEDVKEVAHKYLVNADVAKVVVVGPKTDVIGAEWEAIDMAV